MDFADPAPASSTDSEIGIAARGEVVFYKVANLFGFLRTDDGLDVFMHHSAIIWDGGECEHNRGICARALALLPAEQQASALREYNAVRFQRMLKGARVTFHIIQTERGPEARRVKRIER